jgi:hypothetical protein
MAGDHRVSEISGSRPQLRRDLRTHYHDYRGLHTYVIEDTGKGRFFHVGLPEYQFIQSFDGKTTFAQALARNAATQGEDALTEQQGDQLLRWLVDNDLLESASSGQGKRRHDHHAEREAKKPVKILSKIFFFKIPLGCPDRIVTVAEKRFGWIFGLARACSSGSGFSSTPRPARRPTGTALSPEPERSSPPAAGG